MALFSNSKGSLPNHEALLDTKLYKVPGTNVHITWADAVEGTLITGSTGSGKTSGPARHCALAMLEAGFPMVVLCAKPEERKRWERYAQLTGREQDLVIFNKSSGLKFNFLKYEMEREGEGSGDVLNAIDILMNLNEQSRVYRSGSGANKDERFWDEALRRLISRTISLLKLAGEEISVYNMRKIVANCFDEKDVNEYLELTGIVSSEEEIDEDERKKAVIKLAQWSQSSYFVQVIERIFGESYVHNDRAEFVMDYWLKEFAKLAEKTAGIVIESFMGIIEPFMNDGILMRQFSRGLSEELKPENIMKNRSVLIIDFPAKEFGLSAVFAATIYKTAFQSACERRDITKETDPKPIGLFIDEYQSYCNPIADSLFQATARSSWVACVYITQNINNLYFVMGSNQPEARTRSLLGNLNLKYFTNNSDASTNHWASEMIGKHFMEVPTYNYNQQGEIAAVSKAHQYQYKVTPDSYTTLKKGRETNRYKVEAIVFKPGILWGPNRENYSLVEFDQR